MTNTINKILLFSNPFGYGPTITLMHIIRELQKKVSADLYVIGKQDGLCKEIFIRSKFVKGIRWVDLDERDYKAVHKYISQNKNAAVVSVLNRFSIQSAYELHVPNALVDFLSWFWEAPAREYQ